MAVIDYSSYPIIYPAGLNEAAQYSVNRLAAKLNAKYAMIDVFDDSYKSKPGQKELLIGNTNRPESKKHIICCSQIAATMRRIIS